MTEHDGAGSDAHDAATGGRHHGDHGQGPVLFGQYRWDVQHDRWAWSSGMFTVHGYAGRVVVPTRALLLEHKESSGRARAVEIVDRAAREVSSFANHHRIVDATGRTRTVLSLGSSTRTARGGLVASGFMADLTDAGPSAAAAAVDAASSGRATSDQGREAAGHDRERGTAVALAMLLWFSQRRLERRHAEDGRLLDQMEEALRSRGDIDQALGIIMATQRCSAEAAFDLMHKQSQRTRTRMQDIAVDLIAQTVGDAPRRDRPFSR